MRVLFFVSVATALLALPAVADDGLREDVKRLQDQVAQQQRQIETLSSQRQANLSEEVNAYLSKGGILAGADGDANPLEGITVAVRFTGVVQSPVGYDPGNRTVADGDVDLDFTFKITERLTLWLMLTANTASSEDDPGTIFNTTPTGNGLPAFLLPPGAKTLSGLTDGIGVDGAQPTDPGSITVYEAAFMWQIVDGQDWFFLGGNLDPRRWAAQNAFADDENTQFLNNLFDDPASVIWVTDASGRTVFAGVLYGKFGADKQFDLTLAWFNVPGRFFDNGKFVIQVGWTGQVSGRDSHVRVYGFVDGFDMEEAGGGVSWDWWATEKIGVFVRIGANGNTINPVDFDAQLGAVFTGLVGSRPDDTFGIGLGFITTRDDSVMGNVFPDETEVTIELYYRFMLEGGKLQITPDVQFITDPGGGLGFTEDTLVLLGIRVFVEF